MTGRRRNSYFECKEFRIDQQQCAMKVTTDASAFAAWIPLEGVRSMLDIGTGSGLIALFAAQRCDAMIEGIDIDEDAYRQSRENFAASPWPSRLKSQHISLQAFCTQTDHKFDLISCNPPFFNHSTKNADAQLTLARHSDSLNAKELLGSAATLLTETGTFWVLIPYDQGEIYNELAKQVALHLHTEVKMTNDRQRKPHRLILGFSLTKRPTEQSEIVLYSHHPYHTYQATALLSPYYTRIRTESEDPALLKD